MKPFLAGALLWLAATATFRPAALSFEDEAGYVGAGRMVASLRLSPAPTDPGIWHRTPGGLVPKYPMAWALALAPFLAIHPMAAFALPLLAALALARIAAGLLARWGLDPAWGLIVLIHPTITLLSRTLMADVAFALVALLAATAMSRRSAAGSAGWVALCVILKAAGAIWAGGLIVGAALSLSRSKGSARGLAGGICGLALGIAGVIAINVATTGRVAYAYAVTQDVHAIFGLGNLKIAGLAHLATLLLFPPGLVLGFVELWRRGEREAVCAAAALIVAMSLFQFVDRGRGLLDSMVLSPRQILPALAAGLVGYAAWLARLRPAFPKLALAAAALLTACAVGYAHAGYLARPAAARRMAEEALDARGAKVLGLTWSGFKAGLLSSRRVEAAAPGVGSAEVVLCGIEVPSYRDPGTRGGCELPGYATEIERDGYRVLVRAH